MSATKFKLKFMSGEMAFEKDMSLRSTSLMQTGQIAVLAENGNGEKVLIELSTDSAWRLSQSLISGVMLSEADVYDERNLDICEIMGFGIAVKGMMDNDLEENDYLVLSVDVTESKAIEFVMPKEELVKFSQFSFELLKKNIKYSS